MEIDALALSRDVAGGAVDLPANAVLTVLTLGAALFVEGAEAVRRVEGVPATFYRIQLNSAHGLVKLVLAVARMFCLSLPGSF